MRNSDATRYQIARIAAGFVGALAISALWGGTVYFATSQGASGFGSIGAAFVTMTVLAVIWPIASVFALKYLAVKNWLLVGLGGSVCSLLFISLAGYTALDLGNPWIVIPLFFLASFGLFCLFWRVLRSETQRSRRIFKTIGIAVVAVAASFGLTIASTYFTTQYTNAQNLAREKTYNFKPYVPSTIPAGYHINAAGDEYLPEFSQQAPYYSVTYISGQNSTGDRPVFKVNSFEKKTTFNPPTSCGIDMPPYPELTALTSNCTQIATSSQGNPIYYADSDATHSNDLYYYSWIDSTEVVVSTTTGTGALNENEVIQIIDSLQAKTPQEVNQLDGG